MSSLSIASKLTGAGTVLLIVLAVLFAMQLEYADALGFVFLSDLEGAIQVALLIASIVYVYGIVYSLVADAVLRLLRLDSIWWGWGMHAIGGYLFFLLFLRQDIWFVLVFGSLGALIASVFYAADRLIVRKKWRNAVAFGAPLLLGVLVIAAAYVPPIQVEWVEQRTPGRLEASYRFFHGKQPIPIDAEQGQVITFAVDGEVGYHVVGPSGSLTGMEEQGEREHIVRVKDSGTYRLMIVGNQAENGRFTVTWRVE